jgi:hypothetical protein
MMSQMSHRALCQEQFKGLLRPGYGLADIPEKEDALLAAEAARGRDPSSLVVAASSYSRHDPYDPERRARRWPLR